MSCFNIFKCFSECCSARPAWARGAPSSPRPRPPPWPVSSEWPIRGRHCDRDSQSERAIFRETPEPSNSSNNGAKLTTTVTNGNNSTGKLSSSHTETAVWENFVTLSQTLNVAWEKGLSEIMSNYQAFSEDLKKNFWVTESICSPCLLKKDKSDVNSMQKQFIILYCLIFCRVRTEYQCP